MTTSPKTPRQVTYILQNEGFELDFEKNNPLFVSACSTCVLLVAVSQETGKYAIRHLEATMSTTNLKHALHFLTEEGNWNVTVFAGSNTSLFLNQTLDCTLVQLFVDVLNTSLDTRANIPSKMVTFWRENYIYATDPNTRETFEHTGIGILNYLMFTKTNTRSLTTDDSFLNLRVGLHNTFVIEPRGNIKHGDCHIKMFYATDLDTNLYYPCDIETLCRKATISKEHAVLEKLVLRGMESAFVKHLESNSPTLHRELHKAPEGREFDASLKKAEKAMAGLIRAGARKAIIDIDTSILKLVQAGVRRTVTYSELLEHSENPRETTLV
jgi:hypothetical protein